jgi:hypothetical protein
LVITLFIGAQRTGQEGAAKIVNPRERVGNTIRSVHIRLGAIILATLSCFEHIHHAPSFLAAAKRPVIRGMMYWFRCSSVIPSIVYDDPAKLLYSALMMAKDLCSVALSLLDLLESFHRAV